MAVQVISTEPLFYGGIPTGTELSAEEFIDRQQAFMQKAAIADNLKLRSTVNNLRKEARTWWTTTLPNRLGAHEFGLIEADWDLFVVAFKLEFFTVARQHDATIDWTAFRQRPAETAYHYAGRVFNAAILFDTLVLAPGHDAVPVDIGPADGQGNAQIQAFRTAAVAMAADERRGYRRYCHHYAMQHRERHGRRYATAMSLRVILRGIIDPRLREGLLRASREIHDFSRIVTDLREVELHLGSKGARTGRVAAIDEDNATTTDDTDGVDAVQADRLRKLKKDKKDKAKKAKAAKAAKQGGAPPPPPRAGSNSGKSCTFCHRAGHVVADCRTMQYASAAQKSKREEQAHAGGGLAATAAEDHHGLYSGNE